MSCVSSIIQTEVDHTTIAHLINFIPMIHGLGTSLSDEQLQVHKILEIGCGVGKSTRTLARTHPQAQVIGIDSRNTLIHFAQNTFFRPNLHYLHCEDLVHPPFPDNAFDLIHVYLLSQLLSSPASYPLALATYQRLLQPDGIVRLVEAELPIANSPAYEELALLFLKTLQQTGQSLSLSTRHLGVLCQLESMFSFTNIEVRSCIQTINYAYGTPYYELGKQEILLFAKKAFSLLLQQNVLTQGQATNLEQQLLREINLPPFQATQLFLSISGKNKASQQHSRAGPKED